MEIRKFNFSHRSTSYYFNAGFHYLDQLVDPARTILVTDENIFGSQKKLFEGWKTIILQPGESQKIQDTVNFIIHELIHHRADRRSCLIGVGGGVITDLTGYAASVYMRGIKFGFVPTTVLAMVDAAIGGKNGIDVGVYKNLVGTINQPEFLLYDSTLLKSLPHSEWVNGFAEIIKHACISDGRMFRELENNSIQTYKRDPTALSRLIKRNAIIKSKIVAEDEFEKGNRKLLNFGHTWGHAIETQNHLPHGHAVAIGMVMACRLSEKLLGFSKTQRVIDVLDTFGLPVELDLDRKGAFQVLKMDKKKDNASMNYVLLDKIGKAVVKNIRLDQLEELILSV